MSGERQYLKDRVQRFFEQNPGEELTTAQMCAKFGTSMHSLRNVLTRLRRDGLEIKAIVIYRVEYDATRDASEC